MESLNGHAQVVDVYAMHYLLYLKKKLESVVSETYSCVSALV